MGVGTGKKDKCEGSKTRGSGDKKLCFHSDQKLRVHRAKTPEVPGTDCLAGCRGHHPRAGPAREAGRCSGSWELPSALAPGDNLALATPEWPPVGTTHPLLGDLEFLQRDRQSVSAGGSFCGRTV